jgi:hypothetical protein
VARVIRGAPRLGCNTDHAYIKEVFSPGTICYTPMKALKDSLLLTEHLQQLETTRDTLLLFKPVVPTSASPTRSPRRIYTDPSGDVIFKTYKRIIVCCDGYVSAG